MNNITCNYNFGEKKEENINGIKVPVEFLSPKYIEAKSKAIELLENDKYKNFIKASDFWILVNTYSNKTKAMYSGLIISHDGCLKINDLLDEKMKFKPECTTVEKDGYNNSLVFKYICPEQGIYEVGEVNANNCKNEYPYAMALKRCFDRVVLKNSKIAYSGIYSDSESDDFKESDDHKTESAKAENLNEVELVTNGQKAIIEKYYVGNNLTKLLTTQKIKNIDSLTMLQANEIIKKINAAVKKAGVKNEQ
jgi:hypothetical protein